LPACFQAGAFNKFPFTDPSEPLPLNIPAGVAIPQAHLLMLHPLGLLKKGKINVA
jgi:hypothetical protein